MMDLSYAEKALSENNAQAACDALTALYPNEQNIERIQEFVRYALADTALLPNASGPDQVFLESIAETKRLLRGAAPRGLNHKFIGAELDFICNTDYPPGWSIPQCLNHLLLGRIRPRRRTVVVGTMRDDGIYVLEWVAHYLALGFDHIIIYTNDNSDGSEKLLRLLAAHNIITLIESEISGTVTPEGKSFGHALHLLHELRDFEWALFVDSDEFFVPAPQYDNSVLNVLAAAERQFPEKPPSGICYDWLWFISGMTYARTPDLLLERFQHARTHYVTKSLVRIQDVLSMRREHYPVAKTGAIVIDSAFDPIDLDSILARKQSQYAGGRINHYWPRSFEEFAVKKARGASLKLAVNLYDRPFSKFFAWNELETPENHYPVDPVFLKNIKRKINEVEMLEGVREVAATINLNFPDLVKGIDSKNELRKIYEESMTTPIEPF